MSEELTRQASVFARPRLQCCNWPKNGHCGSNIRARGRLCKPLYNKSIKRVIYESASTRHLEIGSLIPVYGPMCVPPRYISICISHLTDWKTAGRVSSSGVIIFKRTRKYILKESRFKLYIFFDFCTRYKWLLVELSNLIFKIMCHLKRLRTRKQNNYNSLSC